MLLTKENFYETLESFRTFPELISACNEAAFDQVYSAASAGTEKNIVYLFRSAKPVPRLKGESDVLYIGQTKGSFKRRYSPYAKLHATSKANQLKFEHILKNYGPIRIEVAHFGRFGSNLLEAEGQLLWWYFQNHCEYPPLNYSKTNCRNDEVVVEESLNALESA